MKKLTYIWHDCFVMYAPSATLVFDYWKDPTCKEGELPRFLKEARKDIPLYVFVSHHHKDHLNKSIFEWHNDFPNIRYILSHDTARFCRHLLNPKMPYNNSGVPKECVTVLKPGERFVDHTIEAEAFGSTDIGNSYVVEIDHETVFHAGDLNAWVWEGNTDSEFVTAVKAFERILNEIALKHPRLSYAMFPVDSRIGIHYAMGAAILLNTIIVNRFFPMHFGLDEGEECRRQMEAATHTELYETHRCREIVLLQSPYSCYITSAS